jgi:hypothetical protein
MELHLSTFWAPKKGSSPEEYEDAFWPRTAPERILDAICSCAVADGASEASYSGHWARLLTQEYGKSTGAAGFPDMVSRAADLWRTHVENRPRPWYAEQKVASGSFAALIGVTLSPGADETRYVAHAVGDSCLFLVRDEAHFRAFPLTVSTEFSVTPFLLSTADPSISAAHVVTLEGTCHAEDHLLLMTDALAQWYLSEVERGGSPWLILRDLDTNEGPQFSNLIATVRSEGRLRNDDVTLLRVDVLL